MATSYYYPPTIMQAAYLVEIKTTIPPGVSSGDELVFDLPGSVKRVVSGPNATYPRQPTLARICLPEGLAAGSKVLLEVYMSAFQERAFWTKLKWSDNSACEPAAPLEPTEIAAAMMEVLTDARAELLETGRVVLPAAIPSGWLDADQLEADSFCVHTGDDRDGPVDGDEKRRMKSLPGCFCNLLGGALMQKISSENVLGNRDLMEMRLFISQPGGRDMRTHCDDNPDDLVYTSCEHQDDALLGGVLSLEPGTELLFFPNGPSHAPVRVQLAPGDLLLFRGDCWHAGAGYQTKNRRIHLYLSSPARRREPGYTFHYKP